MTPQLGIIFDEPMDVYHGSTAFGVHDLDDLNPHPLLFKRRFLDHAIPEDKDSKALAFGRYFHCLALEGEEAAAARFVEAPDCDRRTTAGKAAFAAFQAKAGSREVITQDDGKLAWRMVQAIREKPGLCKLLDPARGRPEVTVRVQMKFFQLQARIDWYIEKPEGGGPPMCVNLKTIERLADFDSHFWKYGYYRGDAFYRAVLAKALALETGSEPQMVDLAVEKAEPYQAELRVPDAQSLTIGWQEVEHDLMTLRNCFETNTWPGAKDEPRPVSLPSWKTKEAP